MNDSNPKLIGGFVLGGVFLLILATVLFSSMDFFSPKRRFVAHFEQSVNGLNVGAPVKFRGIPIGQVISIEGIYNPEDGSMIPRVTIEVLPETLVNARVEKGEYTLLPSLFKNGLRVSLKSQSMLTGLLYVSMEFKPETPERWLAGPDDQYPELPSNDSHFEEAIDSLANLPIEEVVARMEGTLAAAEDLLRNPNIDLVLELIPKTLTDGDNAIVGLNKSIEQAIGSFTGKTLSQADASMRELQATLQLIQTRLDHDDALMSGLMDLIREMDRTSRSIRALADELERHPESLIRGKP